MKTTIVVLLVAMVCAVVAVVSSNNIAALGDLLTHRNLLYSTVK